jgi:hypothetical protein
VKEYPSIETIFTRSKETHKLNFGEFRNPVNTIINKWTFSEKVDGMNLRVIVTPTSITVKGRTDKAQLPSGLEASVLETFKVGPRMAQLMQEMKPDSAWTFYGEGYGAGIQKGGGKYSQTKRFRGFDIIGPNGRWLADHNARALFAELEVPTVPHLGYFYNHQTPFTFDDLLALVPQSQVAIEDSGTFNVMAEGIVAKPADAVLYDEYGERVLWKLTFREYEKK